MMCSTGALLCSQTLISLRHRRPPANVRCIGCCNHASGNRSRWRRSQSDPRKRTQYRVPFGREVCLALYHKWRIYHYLSIALSFLRKTVTKYETRVQNYSNNIEFVKITLFRPRYYHKKNCNSQISHRSGEWQSK